MFLYFAQLVDVSVSLMDFWTFADGVLLQKILGELFKISWEEGVWGKC